MEHGHGIWRLLGTAVACSILLAQEAVGTSLQLQCPPKKIVVCDETEQSCTREHARCANDRVCCQTGCRSLKCAMPMGLSVAAGYSVQEPEQCPPPVAITCSRGAPPCTERSCPGRMTCCESVCGRMQCVHAESLLAFAPPPPPNVFLHPEESEYERNDTMLAQYKSAKVCPDQKLVICERMERGCTREYSLCEDGGVCCKTGCKSLRCTKRGRKYTEYVEKLHRYATRIRV